MAKWMSSPLKVLKEREPSRYAHLAFCCFCVACFYSLSLFAAASGLERIHIEAEDMCDRKRFPNKALKAANPSSPDPKKCQIQAIFKRHGSLKLQKLVHFSYALEQTQLPLRVPALEGEKL